MATFKMIDFAGLLWEIIVLNDAISPVGLFLYLFKLVDRDYSSYSFWIKKDSTLMNSNCSVSKCLHALLSWFCLFLDLGLIKWASTHEQGTRQYGDI